MKLIIAGSRSIMSTAVINFAIQASKLNLADVTEVVCGMARGADLSGRKWAKRRDIDVTEFPADWSRGNRAGPLRNIQMGEYADAAIVVWDQVSSGSRHMISVMKELRKPVFVYRIDLSIGEDPRNTVWYHLPDIPKKVSEFGQIVNI